MRELGRALVVTGLVLAALGGLVFLGGLWRLPGDVVVRRGNWTVYLPLGTSLLLSLLATLILSWIVRHRL